MLLGNNGFCVPTQPADRQQDTMAAMQATMDPGSSPSPCSRRSSIASLSGRNLASFISFARIRSCVGVAV